MTKKDCLVHAVAMDGWVSVLLCDVTALVATAARQQQLSQLASAALGRMLAMGVLMGEQLKDPAEGFDLSLQGDGPLGKVHVSARAGGLVRGYVQNPNVVLPTRNGKLDVGGGVGSGTLQVVRMYNGRQPYTCSVPLQTGEIAEDFAYYFATSVQQPSLVSLGVRCDPDHGVLSAAGALLQLFPGCPDSIVDRLEDFAAHTLPTASLMFAEQTPQQALQAWFGDDHQILQQTTPALFCTCSRQRMLDALATLPAEDLQEMAADGEVEMHCQFCKSSYRFAPQELYGLLKQRRQPKTEGPDGQ